MPGAALREAGGGELRRLRVHRRPGAESHLPPGGLGPDRPHRGGAGHLRPGDDRLRAAPRGLLDAVRPHRRRRLLRRPRTPVHLGGLRPRRGAAAAGRGLQDGPGRLGPLRGSHRHAGARRRRVLPGRGLPPGLLPQEPGPLQALPFRLRARSLHPRPLERGGHRGVALPQAAGRGAEAPPDPAPVRGHPGGGHRAALPQRVLGQQEGGDLRRHRLRRALVHLRRQVRLGHRVAELHPPPGEGERRRGEGLQAVLPAHRGAQPPRRLAPGPPLQRRARAHGTALLHQLRGPALRPAGGDGGGRLRGVPRPLRGRRPQVGESP